MGRRIEKRVSIWDESLNPPDWNDQHAEAYVRRFIWSGWLVLAELDGSDAVVRKYTWGLDLAGQSGNGDWLGSGADVPVPLSGAGGISGLLAVHDATVSGGEDYVFTYDANGNVGQVLDLGAATVNDAIVARYEYDPYGNVVAQSGAYAAENPFRFSTKYWDDETGLGSWIYRYYNARLGRWLNRDPLEDTPAPNLHAYADNDPVRVCDPVGLQPASQPAVDKSKACCRYEHWTEEPSEWGIAMTSSYRYEMTKPCECAGTPEQCCKCGREQASTTLLRAAWGACCTCRVERRRLPVVASDHWLVRITKATHTVVFIKCTDGQRHFLDHAGGQGKPVPVHVSKVPESADAAWRALVGAYPVVQGSACVPCDEVGKLIKYAESFDGCTYGAAQDCYWFGRRVMWRARELTWSMDACPSLP